MAWFAEELCKMADKYWYGRDGVAVNKEVAIELYQRSADAGYKRARDILTKIKGNNPEEGLESFYEILARARNGSFKDMYTVGHAYEFGEYQNIVDLEEACKWYKLAARNGSNLAYHRLGILEARLKRNNIGKSETEKSDVSSKNNTTSYAEALYKQAQKYWYGLQGVDIDRTVALVLYKKSADAGYAIPAEILRELTSREENLHLGIQNRQTLTPSPLRVVNNCLLGSQNSYKANVMKNNNKKYSTNTLEGALAECRNISEKGFAIAKKNEEELGEIIQEWSNEVEKAKNTVQKNASISASYNKYFQELENTKRDLLKLRNQTRYKFKENAERFQNFTITVFGKTMAGKSTLMEVLREGDGSSIGKGTQRTTRDVRSYPWKRTGIKFYDVPGIASAKCGGEEDSKIAFEAVEYADLVLFLITDDSVQPEEAEWLSKIRKKGKPVVCILNVKACGVNAAKNYEQRVRMVKRKFTNDKERLDAIKNQFLAFANLNSIKQDWNDLPFWYVDLHTAWLSQQDKDHSKELYELSNFKQVEQEIIDIVKNKGAFYQYKTFIDNIYEGIWNTRARLLEQLNNYKKTIPLTDDNSYKLAKLKREIERDNKIELEDFVNTIIFELKSKIPNFVEYHYDDDNCGEAWKTVIYRLELDDKVKTFIEKRDNYTRNRLHDFCSELVNEFRLAGNLGSFSVPFNGEGIIDFKFGVEVAGSVATIGAFFIFGPLGAAAFAIGSTLISWLFDSKEEKIREARHRLEETLKFWTDGSGCPDSETREKIERSFYSSFSALGVERIVGSVNFKSLLTTIIEKPMHKREEVYFDEVDNVFNDFKNTMQDLFCKDSSLENKLKSNLDELNQDLLAAAFKLIGMELQPLYIERELGKKIEICLSDRDIDNEKVKCLNELLQEKVVVK